MAAIALVALLGLAIYVLLPYISGSGSDTAEDLNYMVDSSSSALTQAIAQAIATAEGFYVPGSRPSRNHNPGDMTADLVNRSIGQDGAFVVYANDADGWANLYAQVNAWLQGTSRHANSASTIFDLSRFYTTTDQDAWANTVASQLQVSVDTQIGGINV